MHVMYTSAKSMKTEFGNEIVKKKKKNSQSSMKIYCVNALYCKIYIL